MWTANGLPDRYTSQGAQKDEPRHGADGHVLRVGEVLKPTKPYLVRIGMSAFVAAAGQLIEVPRWYLEKAALQPLFRPHF